MKRLSVEQPGVVGVAQRKRCRWRCQVFVGVRGVAEFGCYGYNRARRRLNAMCYGLAEPPPKPGPTTLHALSCKLLEACGIDPCEVQDFTYRHKVGNHPTVKAQLVPRMTPTGNWPQRVVWAEHRPKVNKSTSSSKRTGR